MPRCPKITRSLPTSLELASNEKRRYYMLEDGTSSGSVRGFGVRVGRRSVTYGVRYKRQWYPIARIDLMALEEARNLGRRKLLEVTAPGAVRKRVTLEELYERFWRTHSREWAEGTGKVHRSVWVNHILPRWNRRVLDQLTPAEIEDMRDEIAKSAARKAIQQLGAAYEYAISLGWIDQSPVRVKSPSVPPRTRRASPEELKAIFKALGELEAEGKDPRPLAVFWAVLFTGCRPGEVVNARLEQAVLDGESPCIVWQAGTAKDRQRERHIWLPHQVAQRFALLPRPNGSVWLVPGDLPGQPYKSHKYQWQQLCKRAGLKNLQLRDLRASVRSELEAAGASLGHVQALLGHRPGSKTTDAVYLRPNVQEARAAGELLEQHLRRLVGLEDSASSDSQQGVQDESPPVGAPER